ncbi:hypothetical protein, partial [Schumannella sp. 10F1B-5-1]
GRVLDQHARSGLGTAVRAADQSIAEAVRAAVWGGDVAGSAVSLEGVQARLRAGTAAVGDAVGAWEAEQARIAAEKEAARIAAEAAAA